MMNKKVKRFHLGKNGEVGEESGPKTKTPPRGGRLEKGFRKWATFFPNFPILPQFYFLKFSSRSKDYFVVHG